MAEQDNQPSNSTVVTYTAADDVWDDSLLIKAYDKSVSLTKEELTKRLAGQEGTSKDQIPSSSVDNGTNDNHLSYITCNMSQGATSEPFKIGDYVRATYDDGIDYEAKIISVNDENQTCVLKYIGYGNKQEVRISDLVPSWGRKIRRLQYNRSKGIKCNDDDDDNAEDYADDSEDNVKLNRSKNSKKSKTRHSNYVNNTFMHDHGIPPPPPMPPMLNELNDDSENLSAMLMSWYMSGYYTGLYQGQKAARNKLRGKH